MSKSIRDAYGEALVTYGKDNPRVVVLDADVSGSTKSSIFGKACPERFYNVGIAEANMVGIAAGMASAGRIPFVNTFAVFLTSIGLTAARAFGSYSNLPIKMVGAYSGLSDAFDGPSHHSLEDIAIMRTLPNFKVFVASDAAQTAWIVKNAIDSPSPMYLRMSRDVFPDIYSSNEVFEEGKGKIVRDGNDATIIACGLMVGNALKAADILANDGINTRVVDMFCIKPLDEALIAKCASETGAIVTAEEHSIYGGLGGAVCESLCKAGIQVSVRMAAINDTHAECGPYAKLQEKYGLDANAIAAKVKEAIAAKA